MSAPYQFTVLFEISNNDLEARLEMPENFTKEDPKHQVSIIHGLRQQFTMMDLGDLDLTSSYDTEYNKKIVMTNYGHLFPMTTYITVEFEESSKAHSIRLGHDKGMGQIPLDKQPILVSLVIAALTAAGTFIVASSEGLIK